jgi:hypothetical protein
MFTMVIRIKENIYLVMVDKCVDAIVVAIKSPHTSHTHTHAPTQNTNLVIVVVLLEIELMDCESF